VTSSTIVLQVFFTHFIRLLDGASTASRRSPPPSSFPSASTLAPSVSSRSSRHRSSSRRVDQLHKFRALAESFRASGFIQRAAELALTPEYWGQHRFGNNDGQSISTERERDHLCNMMRQIRRDFPDLDFDDALVAIGLRRLWDGRRDIVQLVPVQLVGMQAAWLNGAQGMVEGFKDPVTQVRQSSTHPAFFIPCTASPPIPAALYGSHRTPR
jgi:hypothetical protein